ncbi:MAG: integrase core domain-containing protein [Methanomassiliicoccaceae archaeon]|nr:integrase core domain-containing protein [Methanomassiliicoccaceae archaeon]
MGRIGHPETQGKVERSHLSAILETAHIPDVKGMEMRRKVLMDWIMFYNTERPHQSLDYDVPVNVFLRDLKNLDAFLEVGVHEVLV